MRKPIVIALLFAAPLTLFGAMVAADRWLGGPGRGYDYVVDVNLPPAEGVVGLPPVEGPKDGSRPLVVIDPGHGGKDPGAGAANLREKDLTLILAKALRDELLRRGGIRVALTRSDDRFLVLGARSDIARRLGADVFVSVHADSVGTNAEARGASVYTLSDKGSNEAADRIAARENAADVINGVDLGKQTNAVSSILVDLSQRDSLDKAGRLADLILREGQGRIPFRERSEQSAAFVVLKAPDVPSVLFETGYISNAADAARLSSPDGQRAFAEVTARALQVYFARLGPAGRQGVTGLQY